MEQNVPNLVETELPVACSPFISYSQNSDKSSLIHGRMKSRASHPAIGGIRDETGQINSIRANFIPIIIMIFKF